MKRKTLRGWLGGGEDKKKKNASRMHCCHNRTKGSMKNGYIKQLSRITGAETQPLIYLFNEDINVIVVLTQKKFLEDPSLAYFCTSQTHAALIDLILFSFV